MIADIAPWTWLHILTGFGLGAVGVYVAMVRRREPANVAFGAYAVGFGFAAAFQNVRDSSSLSADPTLLTTAVALFALVGAAGLAIFALHFPRRLRRAEWRLLALPLVLLVAGLAALGWSDAAGTSETTPSVLVQSVLFDALRAMMFAAAMLFALRFGAADREATAERRSLAIVSAALVLYPGAFWAWNGFPEAVTGGGGAPFYAALGYSAILSGLWLRNAARSEDGHLSRTLGIFVWVPPLVGMLFSAMGTPGSPSWTMRTAEILVVAYAVLQHQLLGIDVKVRWGISKTTLAAVFVAVFFVASETAQEFFGATLGSSYVGILAAGLLVFAIAPLSRFADRVAERAVPVVDAAGGGSSSEDAASLRRLVLADAGFAVVNEDAYRRAVRLALRGGISREEERDLAILADSLGVGAKRALDIREDLEKKGSS